MRFRRRHRRFGYTLIEIAVTLLIVGILVALAVTTWDGYHERALVRTVVVDIHRIGLVVADWNSEFGSPPNDLTQIGMDQLSDPWGNPYQYLSMDDNSPGSIGNRRKDHNLVPINTDFDLYSMGPGGQSVPPLTGGPSQDDIVRGRNGAFIGAATDY